MSWTEDRVAILKKLWSEGKTAAEIAKELGGVTRNAVIGKAHRLKLSNRASPIQQNNTKPDAVPAETNVTTEKKPEAAIRKKEKPVPVSSTAPKGGVLLADLKEKMCRWPDGDPQEEGFSFCGGVSVPGLPYCEDHAKAAYQSSSRARILQPEDFEDKRTDDDMEEEGLKEAVA